jgi:uncharacterized protein
MGHCGTGQFVEGQLLSNNLTKTSRLWARLVTGQWRALAVSLALGVVLVPSAANADFSDGINAYKQGDYAAALNEWLPYAAENDSRALYNLGQMYRLGQGVKVDLVTAEQYYKRAAKQGHAAARGNLGSIYFTQQPPKIDEALYYWRSAARGGDVRSQYLLGVQYFNGLHVNRDYVLAYAWVSLAAEAGLDEAKGSLDVLAKYLGPQDIAEGVRLSKSFGVPLPKGKKPTSAAPATVPPQPEADLVAKAPAEPIIVQSAPLEPAAIVEEPAQPVAIEEQDTAEPEPLVALEPVLPEPEDRYRVQVAALHSEAEAADYFQRASQNRPVLMADILHYIVRADLGERGIYYRLQLGNFAEQNAATEYCQQLKETALSCYVVASP